MSLAYDQYIREHRENLRKGLLWMQQNLGKDIIDGFKMEDAILNAEQHDESKYSKEEYDAYDAYFYGDQYTDIPGQRPKEVRDAFDYAWLHHIHENPHHWQHWVLLEDDPNIGSFGKVLEMPLEYVYEMIADWWTFSWRNNNLMEIFSWYESHANTIKLGIRTRLIVERILEQMYSILKMQLVLSGTEDIPTFLFYEYERSTADEFGHSDDEEEDPHRYGVPELKKFPMPDRKHVRSAIRFFNYIDPKHEEELAKAILSRMEEFGMSFEDFGVGDENRFKKYIPKKNLEELKE